MYVLSTSVVWMGKCCFSVWDQIQAHVRMIVPYTQWFIPDNGFQNFYIKNGERRATKCLELLFQAVYFL